MAAPVTWETEAKSYSGSAIDSGRGWYPFYPLVREPFTGAWQRNLELRPESIATFHAVYSCITLIASDISKVEVRLVEQDDNGIWSETFSPTFSPVLAKPNRYQNRIKFYEQWIVSKLVHGNTYVLKERDNRGSGQFQGAVRAMYILDPMRTRALVAPDGEVFYQLSRDNLAGITEESGDNLIVPASEIIHDVMVPLYHPLCGVSPLTACGLAAATGLNIQNQSSTFFRQQSQPSGILIAPGRVTEEDAKRLKAHWEANYTGDNVGRVAVVGDGLKYEAMSINAVDAQLIEQLKWSAETVCSCFHVPPHKISIGPMPNYNNVEALDQQYYSQCLQALFENIEICLDEGLGLTDLVGKTYGTEFDLDNLMRMDTATLLKALSDGVRGGLLAPNEGRKRLGYKPVEGGDTPYLQHQDYSLAALAKRDASEDPFAATGPAPSPAPAIPPPADDQQRDLDLEALAQLVRLEANTQLRLLAA
jgi:HK97 family phage portal protein